LKNCGTHACRDTDDNPLIPPVTVSSSNRYHSSFEEEDDVDLLQNPENAKEIGHFEGERIQEGDDGACNEIIVEPTPTVSGIVSLSPESNSTSTNKPAHSAWDVEFNTDTTASMKLNLLHKLTQKGRTYVTFSADGKYLATASSLGIVSIFYSKTGKRIR